MKWADVMAVMGSLGGFNGAQKNICCIICRRTARISKFDPALRLGLTHKAGVLQEHSTQLLRPSQVHLHLLLLLCLQCLSYLRPLGKQLLQIQQHEATLKAAILTELPMDDRKVDTCAQGMNWHNLVLSMQQIQVLHEAAWVHARTLKGRLCKEGCKGRRQWFVLWRHWASAASSQLSLLNSHAWQEHSATGPGHR